MDIQSVKIDNSWKKVLGDEFKKPYMADLKDFLVSELSAGQTIYPKGAEYFAALNQTPFEKVKVVVIGQDPYHGPDQAHGLCFSVKPGIPVPPSLVNIYKELYGDLGIEPRKHGFLSYWAEQGVLMLNSVLTVRHGAAGSHQNKGWETFTDAIIQEINEKQEDIVFVLWGAYAQKKGKLIDRNKHFVIESVHPSPLSAHRGFFGTKPFSKINQFLLEKSKIPIDWELPQNVSNTQ